jgi:tripartite-type tricarboxylate transporter receptor subunit TctC
VPAGTPAEVDAQLSGSLRHTVQMQDFVELVRTEVGRLEPSSPEELTALEYSSRQAWRAQARELGIHLDWPGTASRSQESMYRLFGRLCGPADG